MQSLWSTHRRNKLNINSLPEPSASPGDVPTSRAAEPSTTTPSSLLPSAPSPGGAPEAAPNNTPPEQNSSNTNGKRKTRSSQPSRTDKTIKRSRTAGVSPSSSSALPASGGGGGKTAYSPPSLRLSDLGGVEACIEKVLELVAMPLCHPEIYLHTGIPPPRGVLLHGPPGCGKTMLAHAIAGVSWIFFKKTNPMLSE
jgi:ribosome biogenesis ATPase